MKQKIYQIDAFTDSVFGGNPAAVCILKSWLSDSLMQQIAAENNLAETAFAVPNESASQQEIETIHPNFHLLNDLDCRGVIVSAPGIQVDFVSRFFAPQCGIPEDPVTGSAHTTLTPYWSKHLGKNQLTAKQLSQRGGELHCEYLGERVKISGRAVCYLVGEIKV
ncbi:UNVERIFIED_CONTAM: hypothetical protein GTU68_046643 [Idotea baltica]|nr:hypothetical protein [Idotea baltica]